MIDSETKSLWSHLLGRAMDGELKGAVLDPIVSDMVTWKAWKTEHPRTTVINLSRTHRAYIKEFYRNPDRFVLGWKTDGNAHHISLKTLSATPVVNTGTEKFPAVVTFDKESTAARIFSRRLDGRTLHFESAGNNRMRDRETGSTWNPATGEAVAGKLKASRLKQEVGIMSFAKAWDMFHPESTAVGE